MSIAKNTPVILLEQVHVQNSFIFSSSRYISLVFLAFVSGWTTIHLISKLLLPNTCRAHSIHQHAPPPSPPLHTPDAHHSSTPTQQKGKRQWSNTTTTTHCATTSCSRAPRHHNSARWLNDFRRYCDGKVRLSLFPARCPSLYSSLYPRTFFVEERTH
jgi:hypothetical protein